MAVIETHSAGAEVPSYALYRAPAGNTLQMVVIFAGEAFSLEFQSPSPSHEYQRRSPFLI
jgi:hypothetical protein